VLWFNKSQICVKQDENTTNLYPKRGSPAKTLEKKRLLFVLTCRAKIPRDLARGLSFMRQPTESRIVRFGSFEVDLQEGKLTKGGIRIRLQGQPFQILALLLENPGQVVTREEIRQRLWAHDLFVEFDDALNTSIRKLRAALNDSADNPRFLETVPRRGYRFVAPVSLSEAHFRKNDLVTMASTALPSEMAAVDTIRPPKDRWRRFSFSRSLFAAVALLVAAVGVFWYRRDAGFQVTSKDTIVLADFVNTTGEPVFDDALRQGLEVGLAQSPFIQVMPDRKASVILKQMGHSPDERMAGRTVLEVCQRTGSKAAVQGSIASLGTTYLLGLGAIRCDSGEPIVNEQVQAKRKEDVIDALGRATAKLRARLGESLPSIKKYNAPLEQATTPSLDALNAYGTALSTWDKKGDRASLPVFQKALELDPNFAMAYGAIAAIYHNMGEEELARQNSTKAYALRERVTEAERGAIEARYHQYVTGDVEKAAQVYELWAQNYPGRAGVLNHLAPIYGQLGRYDKAEDTLRQAIRADPTRATAYSNLAEVLLATNRVDDAGTVLAEAKTHKFQTDFLLQANYWRAFMRGDTAEMQSLVSQASEVAGAQASLMAEQGETEAYYGHFQKARALTHAAADLMVHGGDKEAAAGCLIEAAVREAEAGFSSQARTYLMQVERMSDGKDVIIATALVNARIGDVKQAQKLSEELNQKYPENTFVQRYWLPLIRAALNLRKSSASKAVDDLEPAIAVELGDSTPLTLYPAYVRGQAYLAAGDARKAETEFQKLIDHPGIVLNFQLGPLARLGRARSLSHTSDLASARDAYRDFFKLWKDADPDVPMLKQAKAEYTRLQ
jgi:DNA-binding winged helix-turn-helix (wHTH) protein/tetratricopeptide (TPR) repeat protein